MNHSTEARQQQQRQWSPGHLHGPQHPDGQQSPDGQRGSLGEVQQVVQQVSQLLQRLEREPWWGPYAGRAVAPSAQLLRQLYLPFAHVEELWTVQRFWWEVHGLEVQPMRDLAVVADLAAAAPGGAAAAAAAGSDSGGGGGGDVQSAQGTGAVAGSAAQAARTIDRVEVRRDSSGAYPFLHLHALCSPRNPDQGAEGDELSISDVPGTPPRLEEQPGGGGRSRPGQLESERAGASVGVGDGTGEDGGADGVLDGTGEDAVWADLARAIEPKAEVVLGAVYRQDLHLSCLPHVREIQDARARMMQQPQLSPAPAAAEAAAEAYRAILRELLRSPESRVRVRRLLQLLPAHLLQASPVPVETQVQGAAQQLAQQQQQPQQPQQQQQYYGKRELEEQSGGYQRPPAPPPSQASLPPPPPPVPSPPPSPKPPAAAAHEPDAQPPAAAAATLPTEVRPDWLASPLSTAPSTGGTSQQGSLPPEVLALKRQERRARRREMFGPRDPDGASGDPGHMRVNASRSGSDGPVEGASCDDSVELKRATPCASGEVRKPCAASCPGGEVPKPPPAPPPSSHVSSLAPGVIPLRVVNSGSKPVTPGDLSGCCTWMFEGATWGSLPLGPVGGSSKASAAGEGPAGHASAQLRTTSASGTLAATTTAIPTMTSPSASAGQGTQAAPAKGAAAKAGGEEAAAQGGGNELPPPLAPAPAAPRAAAAAPAVIAGQLPSWLLQGARATSAAPQPEPQAQSQSQSRSQSHGGLGLSGGGPPGSANAASVSNVATSTTGCPVPGGANLHPASPGPSGSAQDRQRPSGHELGGGGRGNEKSSEGAGGRAGASGQREGTQAETGAGRDWGGTGAAGEGRRRDDGGQGGSSLHRRPRPDEVERRDRSASPRPYARRRFSPRRSRTPTRSPSPSPRYLLTPHHRARGRSADDSPPDWARGRNPWRGRDRSRSRSPGPYRGLNRDERSPGSRPLPPRGEELSDYERELYRFLSAQREPVPLCAIGDRLPIPRGLMVTLGLGPYEFMRSRGHLYLEVRWKQYVANPQAANWIDPPTRK